ncbi:ABC transporter ATP-binding protein [Rugosimonospora acidiphila]|uniref:ABC transporter ATP-binding protein n=1 Tax=Rugosimonospora acidiphila TaxID=556531 RepID=A0ABP9SQ55_9ACTN
MSVLSGVDLHAGYRGRTVLHGVDLDFGPGLHLLLGPNGAGKTTLFRVLAGVLPPSRGRVLIQGRDPHARPEAKRLVGVAAHRPALAPRLSAADNLRYWTRVLALPAADRDRRVREVIDLLDLGSIADQRADTLSRGQTQRVGLAKALLAEPPVLLLDEPTAAVDPAVAARLRDQLRGLAAAGHTILVSTHELAEASDLADDVTVLHRGRVAARGAPSTLREQLVGHGYRLRLRGTGDLAGALRRLGYPAEPATHDRLLVDVPDEDTVETLVADLVRAGVGIREVTPAGNALEDVYLHLQEGASADAG